MFLPHLRWLTPAAAVAAGQGNDPHFASVVLLIGPTGADASTTVTDESPAAHGTATMNGDAQIDTGIAKFTASLQLDGTGDWAEYIDSPDWDLSDANSDQFTIEAWVRFNAVAGTTQCVCGQRPAAGSGVSFVFQLTTTNKFGFAATSDGTTFNMNVVGTTTIVQDTWYHVATDKDSSGKIRTYIDGVMEASDTPANSAIFNSSQDLGIGARNGAGTDLINGRIEELRITKGVARYATDTSFSVPTARFPRS